MEKEEKKETASSATSLSIDKAAFLLLRVKRVFRKKKQQRKDKINANVDENLNNLEYRPVRRPRPLVRSRTLPAIIAPGINILQAQIDHKKGRTRSDYTHRRNKSLSPGSADLGTKEWPLTNHRLSSPDPSTGFRAADPRTQKVFTPCLSRFSKFLNSSTNKQDDGPSSYCSSSSERRHSWDKGDDDEFDGKNLVRSASIDSIVESKNCANLVRKLPSPLLHASPPSRPNSPNTARRIKIRRTSNCIMFAKFKLSSVTKAFKSSKSQNTTDDYTKLNDENVSPIISDETDPNQMIKAVERRESRQVSAECAAGITNLGYYSSSSTHCILTKGGGAIRDCKIENCCCKAFFRDQERGKRVPFRELNTGTGLRTNLDTRLTESNYELINKNVSKLNQSFESVSSTDIYEPFLNRTEFNKRPYSHKLFNVPNSSRAEPVQRSEFHSNRKTWYKYDQELVVPKYVSKKTRFRESAHYQFNKYDEGSDIPINMAKKTQVSESMNFQFNTALKSRNDSNVQTQEFNQNSNDLHFQNRNAECKNIRSNLNSSKISNLRSNVEKSFISINESQNLFPGFKPDKNVFIFNASTRHSETESNISAELAKNKQSENIYETIKPRNSIRLSFNSKCRTNVICIADKLKERTTRVKNIRQLKRLRNNKSKNNSNNKILNRCNTFNGYDNQAYRKSMTDLNLIIKNEKNVDDEEKNSENFDNKFDYSIKCYNSSISLKKNFENNFHSLDRIQSYNLPVTSFYTGKISKNTESELKKSNFEHLKNFTPHVKTKNEIKNPNTNLRRHGSLGYFQDDSFENISYSLTRKLSLDNLQKVSSSCGIKNLPDVSNKILKQRKLPNLDIHVHALFAAVEQGQVDKAKTILESSDVDVNCLNSDGFTPLDVAVLSNDRALIKLLIAYGAQDGRKFYSAEDLRNHLHHLLHEAERRVQELGSSLRILETEQSASGLSNSSTNIPSITIGGSGGGVDTAHTKTYSIWERRTKGLKKMLFGFEQIRPPDPPVSVCAEVTSTSSVMVYFQEPDSKEFSSITKFKIQWSMEKDFFSLCGYFEVTDPRQLTYHITNLKRGQIYYVRVACGNLKGYSAFKLSSPTGNIPSSWQDISTKEFRSPNTIRLNLEDIYNSVVVSHPYLKSSSDLYGPGGELLVNQRRKKTTIKQLFTAASKFQKHLRRGVYLSCLLYHEDKVLVTNEDFLPVIEIDETYPKKMHADFHWFFKVAFSWCDLKWLKTDMEKSQNSSAVFRIKLLQAATQMQTALSIQELGKLYHKLLRDSEGTIVISVINYIHSPKSVSVLNLRWLPMSKLIKRTNMVNLAESNVADILMSSIPDQITYHQVSNIRLPRGLYLGYLKMRSSVDSLQVLVPYRAPNMPPHCKIRDNPHVTAEEWDWLTKKENLKESLSAASYQQRLFVEQIAVTTRRLFTYMEITDKDASSHRLYDTEVIEVSRDVSLIMLVPPVETACSVPGQRELLLQRSDLLPLTVQVFEMVHFGTYQLDLISLYSRLSCIIEMDINLAQHSLRKAFNSSEVSSAKSKLVDLENLHSQLNTAWKQSRWLLDVISFARDRAVSAVSPSSVKHLLTIHPKRTLPSNDSHRFLQPPEPKTAKSRGSWPGVGVSRHLGRIPTEMSRSEQHLTSDSMNPSQTTVAVSKPAVTTKQQSIPPQIPSQEIDSSNRTLNSENIQISIPVDHFATRPIFNAQSSSSVESVTTGSQLSVASSDESCACTVKIPEIEDGITVPIPTPAIVQIYAAYNTGLPFGTSLKLHVTPKTSAREIVDLFVKQLNMSVLLKGKDGPVYPADEYPKFCLVSVIGARERCLRDDFKLLQLQEPWKDGRLYVRRKSDVLAAIEHSSKQFTLV